MRLARYRGLLLIAAWQAAPITTTTEPDSTGRYRIAFGYGGGQYEAVTTSCEGEVLDAERHSYRTGGARVDAWPADRVRVSGSLGAVRGGPYTGSTLDRRLLVAYEGNRFGIGTGIVRVAMPELDDIPYTFYGRLGLLDDVHLRADLLHPSAVPAMPGGLRVGLASNQGPTRGTAWFVGLAACELCDDPGVWSGFAELTVPVRPGAVIAQGFIGQGAEFVTGGLAAGVQLSLGHR